MILLMFLFGGETSLEEPEIANGGYFFLKRYSRQNQTLPFRLEDLCCQELPEERRRVKDPLVSIDKMCVVKGSQSGHKLTTGPWTPGSPLPAEVQLQALGRDGHLSSSLWRRKKAGADVRFREVPLVKEP